MVVVAQHLARPMRIATITTASGSFELAQAPDGRYAVTAAREPSDTIVVTVAAGTPARADVTLRAAPNARTERFVSYPLPSRGALVRHMAIDPRTHDVWLAYGASLGTIPARVARVRLR